MKTYYITSDNTYAIIEDDKIITYFNDESIKIKESNNIEDIAWAKQNLGLLAPELIDAADKIYEEIKFYTFVDKVDDLSFFLNKNNFKFYVYMNKKYIEINDIKFKDGIIEERKNLKNFLKGIRKSKENYKLGDRVLLYGPTGTGKTFNFVQFLKVSKIKFSIIPVTEGMEDIDFFNRIIPGANGISYKQKEICDLLERAEKGEKVCIIFDELNRGSNSFMNLVLKALDPVDGENYYLTDVIQDRTYVIPQCNIIFGATVNLGGKYTGTNSLDEALLDRFNIIKYVGYDAEVEKEIIKSGVEDTSLVKNIIDFVKEIREYHSVGEIRAPISTRGLKVMIEEFINCGNLMEAFSKTLIFRLVSVDDYGNPNSTEIEIIKQKFDKIFNNK